MDEEQSRSATRPPPQPGRGAHPSAHPDSPLPGAVNRAHDADVAAVSPLPVHGTVVVDPRDAGRSMRVSWHPELGVFVVSLWRDDQCVGTVHVRGDDAGNVVHAFVDGLAARGPEQTAGRRPA